MTDEEIREWRTRADVTDGKRCLWCCGEGFHAWNCIIGQGLALADEALRRGAALPQYVEQVAENEELTEICNKLTDQLATARALLEESIDGMPYRDDIVERIDAFLYG